MTEIDIGVPSQVVFTRLEHDFTGRPVAAFVSRHGDAFCLLREEVELRIRYLEANGSDILEERKALRELRTAGG